MFTAEFMSNLAAAVAEQVVSQMAGAVVLKRLLTTADAAIYLGRTLKAVEHMIARGVIQVTKLDGKIQIDRIALDKLIVDRTYYEV